MFLWNTKYQILLEMNRFFCSDTKKGRLLTGPTQLRTTVACLAISSSDGLCILKKLNSFLDKEQTNLEGAFLLGANIKYEIDKDSGAVVVDRVMYSAMFYPANYGFVANTLSNARLLPPLNLNFLSLG